MRTAWFPFLLSVYAGILMGTSEDGAITPGMLGLLPGSSGDPASAPYHKLSYFFLILMMGAIGSLPTKVRVWDFERALPVTLRSLKITRLSAVGFALSLPICTVFATATVAHLIDAEEVLLDHLLELWGLGGNLLAAVFLATTLSGAWRPTLRILSKEELAGLAALGLAVFAVPCLVHLPWIGALYLAIGVLLLATSLPRADVAVVPSYARSPYSDATESRRFRGKGALTEGLKPLTRVLLRSTLLRKGIGARVLPLVLVLVIGRWVHGVFFLLLLCGASFSHVYDSLRVLRGIDALPLSRNRLLPLVALPPLVLLLVGLTLSGWADPGAPRHYGAPSSVELRTRLDPWAETRSELDVQLRVPAYQWELHGTSFKPVAVAPWGESLALQRHRILWAPEPAIYNPYEVTGESSPRFLLWQLERATGVRIDEASWREDCLESGAATGKFERLNDLEAGRTVLPLLPVPAPPANYGFFQLTGGLLVWIVMMGFLIWPASSPLDWGRRTLRDLLLYSVLILGLGLTFAILFIGLESTGPIPVLLSIAHRTLDNALGASVIGWCVLDLSIAAAGYAWLGRRLKRIEPPPLVGLFGGRIAASIF